MLQYQVPWKLSSRLYEQESQWMVQGCWREPEISPLNCLNLYRLQHNALDYGHRVFSTPLFLFTHSLDVSLFLTETTVLSFKSPRLWCMIFTASEAGLVLFVVSTLLGMSGLAWLIFVYFVDGTRTCFVS